MQKNPKKNSSASKRALREADKRNLINKKLVLPKELGGREGPEPTRYGDWEKKGICYDF